MERRGRIGIKMVDAMIDRFYATNSTAATSNDPRRRTAHGRRKMRTLVLIAFWTIAFGALTLVSGQTQVKTVKLVSVVEDSRCPIGVDCVWAGNAKVEIKVRKSKGAWKMLQLNTGMGDTSAVFEGFEIKFAELTPHPAVNIRIDPKKYLATFVIRRM
jgi:hypothetical protein